MPDIEIFDRLDMTNPTNLRNAGLVGTPPLNDEVLKKLLDYFQNGEDFWKWSNEELEKLIRKEFMAVVHYVMLYGMEEKA